MNALNALFNGKQLSLRTQDSRVHYTKDEYGLCKQLVVALAAATDVLKLDAAKVKSITVEADVANALQLVAEEGKAGGFSGLVRGAFNVHVAAILEHNKANPDKQIVGFPKARDYMSVSHLFRGALEELGASKSDIDTMFPVYSASKKAK